MTQTSDPNPFGIVWNFLDVLAKNPFGIVVIHLEFLAKK
jgi:hypothetical protein